MYRVADNERLVAAQIEKHLKDLKSWDDRSALVQKGCIVEQNGEDSREIDLGFFRRVELVERDIPRDGYADAALTSRMKVRQTNVEITDLRESIKKSIACFQKKQPINLHRLIMDRCASQVQDTILKNQTPGQFEKLIEKYFERQGASTNIPRRNAPDKEGDADIVATFESLGIVFYVQAKRHEGETDTWAVEQIRSYTEKNHRDSRADDDFTRVPWVISTAESFSKDCQKQARKAGVRLISGIEFARMILDAGIEQLSDIEQLQGM